MDPLSNFRIALSLWTQITPFGTPNRVYAEAQLFLLTEVERVSGQALTVEDRLTWLRAIDQALAEHHHAGLRYPPRLLARATALALMGSHISTAVRLAWSGARKEAQLHDSEAARILAAFLNRLETPPMLRSGVAEGLMVLQEANCQILVPTEGQRNKVISLLGHYQLDSLVNRVVEARKERRLFERVLALTRRPATAFMIGDQLDRDIVPAKAAGLITIFFPCGFEPKWEMTESSRQADYTIDDFSQAVSIILGAANLGNASST